ncbi:lanthionine synthetase C family protein [Nocardiopsis sp. CT-R113]|uniref:Lanthionine synthetase C family protein n=1 Tax=Nocardiopsis codii TaxID=3065942 RepID=A0ABU7K9Q4_9ACTN|nr:lanthionine synthetase C family protein [Nocardiopsis sp. CT-R113]MEE2038957.1 lanthionine synthetase C family protein [Nocardiopsis sp. CT-R113]
MNTATTEATEIAGLVADRLATPEQGRALAEDRWWPQSLAHGAAGVVLLHIERARTGHGPWDRVQRWLDCAVAEGVDSSPSAHLYYGAPAVAFVLHQAATVRPGYERELARLDKAVARIVVSRLERARARMDAGGLPLLSEFDTIRGLTGLGALLLARDPQSLLLRDVLAYLVRLTEPVTLHGRTLPGWWSPVGPGGRVDAAFPGGHANTGMAHGIAGPLTLLAAALRRGIKADGHAEAIQRILAWLDTWQRSSPAGAWWPYWVTRAQLDETRGPVGPQRPSWCYGAAGAARAQLLAADALGDQRRYAAAQSTLARVFTEEPMTLDSSLCHGRTGLAVLAHATALGNAPGLCAALSDGDAEAMADELLAGAGIGLLEGAAGIATALHTLHTPSPDMEWATFLLLDRQKHHADG